MTRHRFDEEAVSKCSWLSVLAIDSQAEFAGVELEGLSCLCGVLEFVGLLLPRASAGSRQW
eukprot:CAMPEP_0171561156 /NCGR_PEP_ID=MMETSP0960-20121227/14145_1 /TAXON_ID=87120 /ORGANISM="Aurantiochytrium limacinum, Strain ATCCMYA-1381" /LENGTH=60 /DNA_ID=CAMNT_0012113535 /DNA_START=971 /DNA_END=1153 /DNA_ORIENTATION=+